jgi:hypothetical protein
MATLSSGVVLPSKKLSNSPPYIDLSQSARAVDDIDPNLFARLQKLHAKEWKYESFTTSFDGGFCGGRCHVARLDASARAAEAQHCHHLG